MTFGAGAGSAGPGLPYLAGCSRRLVHRSGTGIRKIDLMISNYFTLASLTAEWADDLAGATIKDAYSPHKDELSIDLAVSGDTVSIRISVRPGHHFVYRALRGSRPKSNVKTLFDDTIGESISSVALHPSDRILCFHLGDGRRLELHLYGARANVFLVSDGPEVGVVRSAFKHSAGLEGAPPPLPKTLPDVDLASALAGRNGHESSSLQKILARHYPRFGSVLLREVLFRAELSGESTTGPTKEEILRLRQAIDDLEAALRVPSARLYELDDGEILSLVPLGHLGTPASRTFSTVGDGVRYTARLRAGLLQLRNLKRPLMRALDQALMRARRKASELEKAASSESRADEYERWGHLLMASPASRIEGDRLVVSNILGDGRDIAIPVKPGLSSVENAERYYERARDLRHERLGLAERIAGAQVDLKILERLVEEVRPIGDATEVTRFQKTNVGALRRFISGRSEAAAPVPFRRFEVSGGLEVWVGRNAQENDRLTFDHASPHDLWFHARGTAGSHVVLKIPGRKIVVGKDARLEAAAIAAWFSSARGSGLVPVIVTERKYVSKPKGSDPGSVRVHRESVLLVKPMLPDTSVR